MSLLKLKDAVVENIEEDIVDYYVFADTYSGVDTETTTNIIITLEDGRTIKLEGYLVSPYGLPTSFDNYGNLAIELVRKVFNNEMEEMTVVDLVRWAFTEYANGTIEINVEDKFGEVERGVLKNHAKKSAEANRYLSWAQYIAGKAPNDVFFLSNVRDNVREIEDTKPDVFMFNEETLEIAGSTLEDFLTF